MRSRLFKLPVVLTLLGGLGLHWVLLQTVAWIGMAVSFSQTDTLSVALKKTFDGQHFCHLCKVVQEGKASEKKTTFKAPNPKMDLLCWDSACPIFSLRLEPPRPPLPQTARARS